MRVVLGRLDLFRARNDKAKTGHALDARVGGGDKCCASQPFWVRREGAEHGYAVDQQFAAPGTGSLGDFLDWVQKSGRGFAVNGEHMGDVGIDCRNCGNLSVTRRQKITFVEQDHFVSKSVHRRRSPQAIGSIVQNKDLAIFRHKGTRHCLDTTAA